jgi:SAM-dependent methyltransferase
MMTDAAVNDGTYALPNEWELADRRLVALERSRDPVTIRRLRALGVGAGWRCLELGAGRGSIAAWLCRTVGPDGTVVALDLDDRFLRALDEPNLEIVAADVVRDRLPAGPFDLIHTRLLLMHLPQRDEVLERIVPLLDVGGVVLFEEHDAFPVMTAGANDAYGAAWAVFVRAMEAGGVAPTWVRELPARCAALGLADIGCDVDVGMFTAGDPEAEFWRLTWLQAAARVIAAGAPNDLVDAGIESLGEPGQWRYGPAMVAVSARRP